VNFAQIIKKREPHPIQKRHEACTRSDFGVRRNIYSFRYFARLAGARTLRDALSAVSFRHRDS
jgi:hypothetical protein